MKKRGRPPLPAILLALLAVHPRCAAAAPRPAATPFEAAADAAIFSSLGARDGLSNASVSAIVQDSSGFLWFGTQGGLDRYDGFSFKVFESQPFEPDSLGNNQVQTLYLDGGILWVGTYGGLYRLDLATERFTGYRSERGKEDSLSNDVVVSIARDARGSLWVGTLDGLNLLDEGTGRFKRFRSVPGDPRSLPANLVRSICVDRASRLWIGTSGGGLARYDYGRGDFATYRNVPGDGKSLLSDYVMCVREDPSGSLWVGTWYGGISRFDPESGGFENFPAPDERVYTLLPVEGGLVYVGTWGGGLLEFDAARRRFTVYRAGAGAGNLTHDVVYSMLRDRSGELWFGTNGGGANKLGRTRRSYRVIEASADPAASFPRGKVYAALEDGRGDLWVGVYNGGLSRRDAATGRWRRYARSPSNPRSLPNDIVNFAFVDRAGALWAGTNDGLARYDPRRDDFETYRPGPGRTGAPSSEIVTAMDEAPGGGYWIGTFRSGLDFWDPATGAFRSYRHDPADPGSLSDNLVFDIEYDAIGRLWIGTNDGLNRLDGDKFVHYYYDPGKSSGPSNDSIKTIFRDSLGSLWLGTAGGGLMRYEAETDSFVTYSKKDGLPSNAVSRILEDRGGGLWIATQAGLAVYDRSAGAFRRIAPHADLRDREFFSGGFRSADGSLYFGVLDALCRFDPGGYEYNDHRPPVTLTELLVGGKPRSVEGGRLRSVELPWREPSIELRFAAMDFRDPASNLYRYRLEGFDRDWSSAGSRHWAAYTNLPGGKYVFRVKASNNDGLWNDQGLSIAVSVGRRPWTHPLAICAYAAALAAAAAAIAARRSASVLAARGAELAEARRGLAEAEARLGRLSAFDGLTGAYDRRGLDARLASTLESSKRERGGLAALLVDIDRFDAYNAERGRQAGDECLRRVAACVAASLDRAGDSVTRYGGEEFLVLMPNAGIEAARAVGERARRAVEALSIGGGGPGGEVTVSVGCAALDPGDGRPASALLSEAERALYEAKARGRNRVAG